MLLLNGTFSTVWIRFLIHLDLCIISVTFYGRIFLQKLWKVNKLWYEPLSNDLMKDWDQIAQILAQIPSLKLPRLVRNSRKRIN